MIVLTGKNLRERQKQLNNKVNDAAKENIDFNNVKHQTEISDVDKLFKIDLAAKYKHVEYILEIFMCGDALYISRAINKCTWLSDKDYTHIVNNDYLSKNIFPFMSIKMRNKVLSTLATTINDDERAVGFYTYCMKIKLHNIALKFLLHTPESFRFDVIIKKSKVFRLIIEKEGNYLEHFIGESFSLAESYVHSLEYERQKSDAIYMLRYMYSLSNEKYLDMLEDCNIALKVFGRRLSRHIMQTNKTRVMKKPILYANVLNKNIISRNCSIEDTKIFAVALLPDQVSDFFSCNYYASYKFILDLIPTDDKFLFVKKIFTDKYPGQAFETCSEFYSYSFYDMMTLREKENWALKNIESQEGIIDSGKDYLWYKFVNFDKSLIEIKKYIMKTTDKNKRCEMLKVLIECAKTEEEVTKLLNYFYERHMNEVAYIKDGFVAKLANDHKLLRFGKECWMALEKILYRLDIFDKSQYLECNSDYRVITLMYYIINEKPVLEVLNEYIEMDAISLYAIKKYEKDLSKPEKEMIFKYLIQFYTETIKTLSKAPYDDDTKNNIRRYLCSALDLFTRYDKTKDDIPEIMHTYIKLDWSEFKHYSLLTGNDQFSSSDIIHYLKEDVELVVSQFSKIKQYIEFRGGNINWLISKLKVFFSDSVTEKYLILFHECLIAENLSYNVADVIVRGILVLADEASKIDFLRKYEPTDKRRNCGEVPINTIYIQRAICRQMHCSRPPLPLSNVMQYVIGDHVQYCLTLFRAYMLNLPFPQCLDFVESMIDKPISTQKHGLRLAFECFDAEKLKTIILERWNKTKNVSLRSVLYKSLFIRVMHENEDAQIKLFEVLVIITSDLQEDDDEELFKLIRYNNFPDNLVGRYLESVWNTVSKFIDNPQNLERMVNVIQIIERRLYEFSEDALYKIIENHVNYMLDNKQILKTDLKKGFYNLIRSKWHLTIANLVFVNDQKKLMKSIKVVRHIMKHCVEMWNDLDESNNMYVVRHFMKGFINDLDLKSYNHDEKSYSNVVIILQLIKEELMKSFEEKEIYMLCWKIDSSIITKKAVVQSKEDISTAQGHEKELLEVRRSGISFGSEFGILIKKYVEGKNIYSMFYEQIASIASTMILNYHNCVSKSNQLSESDVYILFCLGLVEVQIVETYMIATKLLPTEYEDKYMNDYLEIIKNIQVFPNRELQCYMYDKFVNTDFKLRHCITVHKS